MNISALYSTMATLFTCMAVGYLARRLKVVNADFVPNFSKLIIHVLQPFMIINSVLNKEHLMSNEQVFLLTGIALACYVVLIGLALLLPKFLHMKVDKGTYRFMFIFGNVGFMGYPVVRSLFGDDAMFMVTIFILLFNILVYTVGILMLAGDKEKQQFSFKMFVKPTVIACVVAYAVYFINTPVPELLATCVAYVGDLTTPACMVLIGCSLGAIPVKEMGGTWRLYAVIALKMVVIPVIAFLLLRTLVTDAMMMGVIVVMLAMPIATNATMLSAVYGGNDKLASTGVLISTLLSVGTIPVLMQILFG
ncbi:MAG: AEC family transporter [Eubacteriales bacterium]